MPTLAELARSGALGAATAPLTDATTPQQVPPEITLALLARAGLLGPGQASPLTVAAGMPRGELTNPTRGLPSGEMSPDMIGDAMRGPPPPQPATLGGRPPPTMADVLRLGGRFDEIVSPGSTVRNALMPQSREEQEEQDRSNRLAGNVGDIAGAVAPFAIPGGAAVRGAGALVRGAGNLMARNPGATAATLGTGVLASLGILGEPGDAGAQRNPPPDDRVKALQRRLQDAGLYSGNIDGIMGNETREAAAKLEAREARAAADRARQTDLDLQKARNETERERIRLEREREERSRIEGERANEVTREGMERFRNIRPSPMQEYGPYLGYPLGFAMGLGGRYGMSRVLNREARELSGRAGDMARNMGTGDVPERVGRMTEFWNLGAPGRPPPYTFASGRQPFPWTNNPAAPPSAELYGSGNRLTTYGPGALTAGVGGSETGLGYMWLQNARRELEAAQAALDARDAQGRPTGMTPANVQRLEDARGAVSQAEFLMRTGMGTLAGGTVGELESVITRGRLRPSIQAAEAERGRLDQLLNPAGPPAPRPTWDANVNRWRLNGGFVAGPRNGPP